jgi:hypothetical protein
MEARLIVNRRLVFISHSGPDTWVARQIAREVEARGATPFLDEAQVDAGADFEEDILNFFGASSRTRRPTYAVGS